jgi:hypothetical protein
VPEPVSASRRFSPTSPCPVCGGHERMPRGKGRRCFGFRSADGWFHCSRAELAGSLPLESDSQTFPHRPERCPCGTPHGQSRPAGGTAPAPITAGKRQIVAVYAYQDEKGQVLFETVRWSPKGFSQRRPDGGGGYIWNIKGVRLVPFGLPEILGADSDATIFIVEGEKDVVALRERGLIATCNPMGAGKWRRIAEEARRALKGRPIVVIPDNDDPGRKHGEEVIAALKNCVGSVRLLALPELPPHGDVSDWLAAGHSPEELHRLVASTPGRGGAANDNRGGKVSAATALVRMAEDAELFHSPDGRTWVTVAVDNHRETHALDSQSFSRWLARRFFLADGTAPGSQALSAALNVLAGKALYEGPEMPVFVRVAGHPGAVYLDLCDPAWRVVEITAHGWRLVDRPPVKFRRARGMLALPEPQSGETHPGADLRQILNIVEDRDWRLILAWLVGALQPVGPFPVLALHGEQGSAKSTTARILRALIDPSSAPLRAEPREPRDLAIAASNGWVIALDNLSYVPDWLSDALCRLSTGGGFSTRALFTNDEEVLFDAKRPIILNGIDEVASRSDLLDRAIVVSLPAIHEESRRPESEVLRATEAMCPGMLGTLLDGIASALRDIESTRLERLPRMADFARWATAAEPGLGLDAGVIVAAYDANRSTANEIAVDVSAIGGPIRELVADGAAWTGTASELLEALGRRVSDATKSQRGWPKNARALSGAIRRLAPNLRAVGVAVSLDVRESSDRRRRLVSLEPVKRQGGHRGS